MPSKSLYLHIPFCDRKCFYCSFVVSIAQQHRQDEYVDALLMEMQQYDPCDLETIYLGGGTPSLLTDQQIIKLFEGLKHHFHYDDVEITIELNPENLDQQRMQAWQHVGINRISLGVQSFDDARLKYLGRIHNAQTAVDAFHTLRAHGFHNISMDLMYGYPQQTQEDIVKDIDQAIALHPDHISMYGLTVEEKSRFFAQKLKLDEPSILQCHHDTVVSTLTKAGFDQYEVSNFCQSGKTSQHNQHYWQGNDYIGLGVGAHGFVDGKRMSNTDNLFDYLKHIKANGQAIKEERVISAQEYLSDLLIFGLRMNAGVHLQAIQDKAQTQLTDTQQEQLHWCVEQGLLEKQNDLLRMTWDGQMVLDEIAVRLI